ncbi:MAG: hypothetical protein Q9M44_02615, partial [Ghiorsea sp.]|nr:hypothetical protein [Ghiorsea sp.]
MTEQKTKASFSFFKLISFIKGRLAKQTDTEYVQAIIRLVIVSLFALYFYVVMQLTAFFIVSIYLALAVLHFFWIILSPPHSKLRKIIGIIGDMTVASLALYLSDEVGALLLPVYL